MWNAMRKKRRASLLQQDNDDPLSVVVNLFDVAMVFAVSLMVAMVMHLSMNEVFGKEDFTVIKNPGAANMEIVIKKGKEIKTFQATDQEAKPDGDLGRKVGTAYKMSDGRIIYVPDTE